MDMSKQGIDAAVRKKNCDDLAYHSEMLRRLKSMLEDPGIGNPGVAEQKILGSEFGELIETKGWREMVFSEMIKVIQNAIYLRER